MSHPIPCGPEGSFDHGLDYDAIDELDEEVARLISDEWGLKVVRRSRPEEATVGWEGGAVALLETLGELAA